MRVVIYSRVSLDRWGDERSPARQEAACRSLAASREWTVVEVLRDVDTSAYKEVRRPGFAQVVSAVQEERCDAVCVWKLDRLVRRPREFESFWAECDRAGVALVSVTEPIDTSTELGLAIVRVLVTFAGLESATRSVRIKAAARERALQGLPHTTAQAPYGYSADWSAVVPEEAALIREGADRVLAGETMASVVRDWTLRGVRTRTNALWSVSKLRHLLISPRLWGVRTHLGDEVAEGAWPKILSPLEGARLQYLLADPSRRREPRQGHSSLLTTLLRCAKCGGRMVSRPAPRGERAYACQSPPRGCNGVNVRQIPADRVVVEALMEELDQRRTRIVLPQVSEALVAAAVRSHGERLRAVAADYYVNHTIDRPTFLSVRDALDRSLYQETLAAPMDPDLVRHQRLLADLNRTGFDGGSLGWGSHAASG